jgi:predicted SAM-dependent methyltransferase
MAIEKLKIDFGGGLPIKNPDYEKCDILKDKSIKFGGVDFEKDKLPFKDNQVIESVCYHCLEHIENVRHFLNELHRVIDKNGFIKIIVPYALHRGSYKPVHKQYITECWFDFLRKENSEKVYGFKVWKIKDDSFIFRKNKQGEIYELEVILIPKK